MKERDVVLTPLPQADGLVKNRPVVVLRVMPPHGDLLVCGVRSQLPQEVVGFDDVIRPGDVDFADSGLKAQSLIRLSFLAVLPTSSFAGTAPAARGAARTPHRRTSAVAWRWRWPATMGRPLRPQGTGARAGVHAVFVYVSSFPIHTTTR